MRKWLFICGLWAIFAAFYSAQSYTYRASIGRPEPLPALLLREILYVGLWAALTPLILALARRLPVDRRTWPVRVPLHLLFALVLAVLQRLLYETLSAALRAQAVSEATTFQAVIAYFDYGMFLYFIVLLIAHAVEFYGRYQRELTRAAQLRADLHEARLATLRAQLQPHFLFNTLNAISTLVRSDPRTAEAMIQNLSDFLRATLDEREARVVPLRRELAVLDRYLEIERTRFGDRLQLVRKISPDSLGAEVPFLVLQPLVENAIRHGIAASPGPGILALESRITAGALVLSVSNTGVPEAAPRGGKDGFGLGLANTRARLGQLYGTQAAVELSNNGNGGSTVTVTIPLGLPAGDA